MANDSCTWMILNGLWWSLAEILHLHIVETRLLSEAPPFDPDARAWSPSHLIRDVNLDTSSTFKRGRPNSTQPFFATDFCRFQTPPKNISWRFKISKVVTLADKRNPIFSDWWSGLAPEISICFFVMIYLWSVCYMMCNHVLFQENNGSVFYCIFFSSFFSHSFTYVLYNYVFKWSYYGSSIFCQTSNIIQWCFTLF